MVRRKDKTNYIFPDFLGRIMSKVDLRTQYEASMLSMTFILIGLITTGIYMLIYADFRLWYKIFLIVNIIAGIIFISSYITTTFQQYKTYMEVRNFQEKQNKSDENENEMKGG